MSKVAQAWRGRLVESAGEDRLRVKSQILPQGLRCCNRGRKGGIAWLMIYNVTGGRGHTGQGVQTVKLLHLLFSFCGCRAPLGRLGQRLTSRPGCFVHAHRDHSPQEAVTLFPPTNARAWKTRLFVADPYKEAHRHAVRDKLSLARFKRARLHVPILAMGLCRFLLLRCWLS